MIYVSVWHFSADSLLRGAECFGDKHLTAVGHLKDARAGKQRFKKSGSKGQRRRRNSGEGREKGAGWQKGGQPRGELEGIALHMASPVLKHQTRNTAGQITVLMTVNCCGEQDGHGSLFFSIYSVLNSMCSCAKAPFPRMLAECHVNAR